MSQPQEPAAEPTSDRVWESEHHPREQRISFDLLRRGLPACQPQEGSPPNTFTESEIQELSVAFPELNLKKKHHCADSHEAGSAFDLQWEGPADTKEVAEEKKREPNGTDENPQIDWYGAPHFENEKVQAPRSFRSQCRQGTFTDPTNGICPGFLQCNLVVLPEGKHAFDFLLFCQRNPKSCPLIEVLRPGETLSIAPGADLRTDIPRYVVYRDGELVEEVTDATEHWPQDWVAFLIGCSFSYDGALLDAGIPLRSAEQGRNVPMYETNLKCRPSGSLNGNVVVSMKPIPALQVAREVEITSKYAHAHGGPICIGRPDVLGIANLSNPDWGDAVDMKTDEVPVFHMCGVTPQAVLKESRVPFAITHSAGHMFVSDMPSHMGVL